MNKNKKTSTFIILKLSLNKVGPPSNYRLYSGTLQEATEYADKLTNKAHNYRYVVQRVKCINKRTEDPKKPKGKLL